MTAALRKNAARELDGEHLLVDRRYKRVKEVKKIPDSFQLALSAIKDTDQNSIHFFQALIKMGLDITQVGVSHIAAKPRNDYWTKAGVDVRLREDRSQVFLTVKNEVAKDANFVKREEIPVEVVDSASLSAFLEQLGYECRSVREKKNTKYALGKAVVEIRQAPHVAPLLEIEGGSIEDIQEALRVLEIPQERAISLGDTKFLKQALPPQHAKKINDLRFPK
jgi:hypothetical protein